MSDPLLAQSRAERDRFFDLEGQCLERLAREGQAPDTMFIGCSDSRVVAESLLGARPGDLFVVRVVGNVVPPHGSEQHGVGAAVELAVDQLRVKHIVVCGHTDCGGVRALDSQPDPDHRPHLALWLHYAQPALRQLPEGPLDPADRHLALVEANVRIQLGHLRTYPAVQRGLADGTLSLHGWVYDITHCRMHYLDPDTGAFAAFDG